MAPRFDVDDLQHFLAVSKTGSTLRASRKLSVSQSTVSRRIAALEGALGIRLFDKLRTGYVITDEGRQLLASASAVRAALDQFSVSADALGRGIQGIVRFSTAEPLAEILLPEIIRQLQEKYPLIRLEADTTRVIRDLSLGEADVCLRAAQTLDAPGLFGRRLAVDRWSLYCSQRYAETRGVPSSEEELANHSLVGFTGDAGSRPAFQWSHANFPAAAIILRQNSVPAYFQSVRSGLGVGFYSDFVAAACPDLVWCFRPDLPPALEIWLLTSERLKDDPRVRAVMDVVKGVVLQHKLTIRD